MYSFRQEARFLVGSLPLALFLSIAILSAGTIAVRRSFETRIILVPGWTDPLALVVFSYSILFMLFYAEYGTLKALALWMFVESLFEISYLVFFPYNAFYFASIDPLYPFKLAFEIAFFAVAVALFIQLELHRLLNRRFAILIPVWLALWLAIGLLEYYHVEPLPYHLFSFPILYALIWGVVFWKKSAQ